MEKGQVTIEYLIALMVFSSILIFLVFEIAHAIPEYRATSQSNVLDSKAFRVAEIMVTTTGYSISGSPDWNAVNVGMIGLASKPRVLGISKLSEFNKTCSQSYESTKQILGVEGDFAFRFSNASAFISCGKRIPAGVTRSTSERYVSLGGNWARVTFDVW
ncbi:MAG: hypothetical protein HZB68_01990 [Candidatus Aenigmarchaeota archaeon]|nr:hypothetical protein [Candidatus Aenigmarchaeota archaeon]